MAVGWTLEHCQGKRKASRETAKLVAGRGLKPLAHPPRPTNTHFRPAVLLDGGRADFCAFRSENAM
jgi:hypothetical protein